MRAVAGKAEVTCEGAQVGLSMRVFTSSLTISTSHQEPLPSGWACTPPWPGTAQGGDSLKSPQGLITTVGGEKVKGLIFILWDRFPLPLLPPTPSLFATLC